MRIILSIVLLTSSLSLHADDNAIIAEVRSADDARVAAMIAVDSGALDVLLSDRLYCGHSGDGFVEDKQQHIASLVTRRLVYQHFDFKVREFRVIAPGAVVCKGHALVEVGNPRMIFLADINFLAVWRLENAQWKLFAWQSSRNKDFVPLASPSGVQPKRAPEPTPGPAISQKSLPPPTDEDMYTITRGDTGARIAAEQKVTIADLLALNPGVNWARLSVGQQIRIRPKKGRKRPNQSLQRNAGAGLAISDEAPPSRRAFSYGKTACAQPPRS
jgi:LysM repeat protein